jgi:hypothetical protein
MSQVIIGMDPHKRSATIEVMAGNEAVVGGGRYGTDAAGYAVMPCAVNRPAASELAHELAAWQSVRSGVSRRPYSPAPEDT